MGEARGERVDVAILGGGIAGITAALEARRRGARVMLFDPGPIGGT
jgi:glycine/D-amino acid oxidase-like deaminating enzyme